MMKFQSKFVLLLLPAILSMGYFSLVSGLDLNMFSREMLIMMPLQILAFVYVGYQKYRN
jgi:hypothetical protein